MAAAAAGPAQSFVATARADQLDSIPEYAAARSQSEYNVLGGAGAAALGSSQADIFVEDQKFPVLEKASARTQSTLNSIVSLGGLLKSEETP